MNMMPSAAGGPRGYDAFRMRQIQDEDMRKSFDILRDFCISLGDNVIEDVRPHRVVFCKTMNTRWFADAKPSDDSIDVVIKIRTGWRDPIRTITMGKDGVTQEIKEIIKDAYLQVR